MLTQVPLIVHARKLMVFWLRSLTCSNYFQPHDFVACSVFAELKNLRAKSTCNVFMNLIVARHRGGLFT